MSFEKTTPPRVYVLLVAGAIIYGAVFTVNKMAAEAGVMPLAYGFWQSFGAGTPLMDHPAAQARKIAAQPHPFA